jgi:hypothetical protein
VTRGLKTYSWAAAPLPLLSAAAARRRGGGGAHDEDDDERRPVSRSFVLAALRALHRDPDPRSAATKPGLATRNNLENQESSPLRGSSTQISVPGARGGCSYR